MTRRLTKQVIFVLMLTLVVFLIHLWAQNRKNQTPETVIVSTATTTASPTPPKSPTPFTATPTISPTNTPEPTQIPQFYTVLPDETLGEIAYKLGLSVEDLALANHITDINLIYAGQQLYIGSIPIIVPEPSVLIGKQIIVILSTQRAYAFEDGVLAHTEFIVATGIAAYPTVTGNYEIYVKYESTRMTGPGYDIANVPWTMYFFKGYGLHGAPWNHNLGHPGSHGCVNMSVDDADWLFHWASVGTPVTVLP